MKAQRPMLQALACALLANVLSVHAANECKVTYGWHEGSGASRQDKTKTELLNAGQSKQIQQNQLNFVRNEGSHAIDAVLGNKTVALGPNQVDPPFAFYLGATELRSVHCKAASAAGFQTPQALVQALKAANTAAGQVASQLKTTFNQTNNQIAALMKGAGYTAAQIAEGLRTGVNASASQVAQALKAAGYAAEQIAGALRSAFNASAAQVAQALRAAGYAAEQVASAIKSAFNATNEQLAAALQAAGFTLEQIAGALRAAANVNADLAARILAELQAAAINNAQTVASIIEAIRDVYGIPTCGAAGCPRDQWRRVFAELQQRGANLAALAFALRSSLQASTEQAVEFLSELASGTTRSAMEAALRAAGYAVATINAALDEAYGTLQPLKLEWAYHLRHESEKRDANDCNYTSPRNRYGYVSSPLPLPAGAVSLIAFYGQNMHTVRGITGLPAGASTSLIRKGKCLYIARVDLTKTRLNDGTSGQATMLGAGGDSARITWTIGPADLSTPGGPPQLIRGGTVCSASDRAAGRCQ